MVRYWPVAVSGIVLLAAIGFLITSRSEPARQENSVLPAPASPTLGATSVAPNVPGAPIVRPYPLLTPVGTPGPDIAVESGRGMWLSLNQQVVAVLSVLLGDTSYCANLCPLPLTPEETLAGVVQECARYDPNGFRFMWANYPDIVAMVNAYDDACKQLRSARDRLGAYADSTSWRDVLSKVVRDVAPVIAGRQLPQLPGPLVTPSAPLQKYGGFYPLGTNTGILPVDRFLRLLYANHLSFLADDAIFNHAQCTTANMGPGTIVCPQGVPDGGSVEILLFGSCAPNYVFSRDQLRERLQNIGDLNLYAVYSGGMWGAYGVALVAPGTAFPVGFYLDAEGRMTAFVACGGPQASDPNVQVLFPPRGS